ncbi:cell division protein FtsY [Haloarcula hispanica N601]|uniref:Signal recognition particle receptor FtsY n=3 Tax=Haloarcula hispanica TaxID=51589 RepID=V5THQ4_HALHI|nr:MULTISPECIES: signal recognition particle-docking protein FtsY [Haloarcula]AEM56011.1 signal recognition particle receptor [Haloarcula hispanica ATCC 33960]AHB64826.1 cell division protein FtsY [Haloarcula hispanica N601]AJF26001.1 cell division protein FtsY [Haloarcula sp. CBA1115]KAA9408746.1 signal recognition particle-docking protein FtsY [Haloarcula hispanica]
MFDGLKDKLSGFTSDVEEDVDDDALEAEDEPDADGADGEATADQAADAEPATDSQPSEDDTQAAAVESDQPQTGSEPPAADSDAIDEPATASSTAVEDTDAIQDEVSQSDDATEVEDDSASDTDSESEEDDDGGRGLAAKAKLMATGKTVIEEEDLQSHLDDLELALLSSDVEMSVANEILDGVKENLTGQTRRRLSSTGNLVRDALRESLYDVINVGQFDFDERVQQADKPVTIVFTGVNGVGKTTSIAKLAQYFEERGLSTVLANGDTYRAGANEQLEKHAENLDKKIITHEQGSDPTAVVYDAVEYAKANDIDVVLGDTAGRLHTSDDLMAQLEKIDRNIDPDMTLFVDEAVAGQDAVNRAREFNDAAEIDGAILTKADADPQGGAAISVAHVTGKPILFLGTGQDYGDLEPFDPEEIVDSLIGE